VLLHKNQRPKHGGSVFSVKDPKAMNWCLPQTDVGLFQSNCVISLPPGSQHS
jgi:hypothetical protein